MCGELPHKSNKNFEDFLSQESQQYVATTENDIACKLNKVDQFTFLTNSEV